jgi:DNA-directed RNA polymerase specialized sigma24 family protein
MGKVCEEAAVTAPQWPEDELDDFYRLFQRMRETGSESVRRKLAFQCVLHQAAMCRMTEALERFRKPLDRRASDLEDLFQATALRLVRILTSETLSYKDYGLKSFAAWYWTICKNVSSQAAQRYLVDEHESVDDLEEDQLPVINEPPPLEFDWDDVALVIDRIRDPLMKAVMVDAAAGIPETKTALEYHISISYVSKLRSRGIELVRRACRLTAHY